MANGFWHTLSMIWWLQYSFILIGLLGKVNRIEENRKQKRNKFLANFYHIWLFNAWPFSMEHICDIFRWSDYATYSTVCIHIHCNEQPSNHSIFCLLFFFLNGRNSRIKQNGKMKVHRLPYLIINRFESETRLHIHIWKYYCKEDSQWHILNSMFSLWNHLLFFCFNIYLVICFKFSQWSHQSFIAN